MNRRRFLDSVARAMLAVTVPGALPVTRAAAQGVPPRGPALPEPPDHLALGLTAMAGSVGWFDAHWGAAAIAARYLCDEAELDAELRTAIGAQLDVMVRLHADRFRTFEDEPLAPADEDEIETLAAALPAALEGGLRHSGHAPIYVALATRALRDRPALARPAILGGIRGHVEDMSRMRPKRARGDGQEYRDTRAMVRATFESIARFEPLVGFPTVRRPNFTHMLTHTDALVTLEGLGFEELSRQGHAGHRAHIDAPVPAVGDADRRAAEAAPSIDPFDARYWRDEERHAVWARSWDRTRSPNGDWIASGHLFKILYAFERLARTVEDDELVERVAVVAFERYLNPDVSGG